MTPGGPAFSLQGVTKRFGRVTAVDGLWLDIEEGEFFSLLGPSGCGKTTTLRMLAGFEEPDEGRILLRSTDVTTTAPNKRDVNLVFQHYELFPHMSVFENVAFGLRLRKVREPDLGRRVREALEIVRVGDLEQRGARQLSGGQQQRVALARAIVNRPAVLLLDEPLSALDVKLRKQMQLELKAIQDRLGTTFVYVTHDQEEALLLSDRVAVMDGGRLLQVATPRDLYERPADAFVADFIGSLNVLEGRVVRLEGDAALARPEGVRDEVDARLAFRASGGLAAGDRVHVAVRPERVALAPASGRPTGSPPGDLDPLSAAVPGRIEQVIYLGSLTQLIVSVHGEAEVVCQRANDGALRDLGVGMDVWLTWPAEAAFVLPDVASPRPGGFASRS